jgi:hypothetical protein
MRIDDFTQDMSEPSNAHAGEAMNELRNAARGTPLPPPPPTPPVSLEQLLATQSELMRVLIENLMQCEVHLLHRQPGVETSYTDFLAMHPRHLPRRLIRWRWIFGFTSSSPSLGFCTSLRSRRLCSQPSNFMDLRVLGGLTSLPLLRTATRCRGLSFAQLFMCTISPCA